MGSDRYPALGEAPGDYVRGWPRSRRWEPVQGTPPAGGPTAGPGIGVQPRAPRGEGDAW